MKRLSIILLLLFALALGSCGTPPPQSETGNAEEIDLTYKITPEGEILSHEVTDWLPY